MKNFTKETINLNISESKEFTYIKDDIKNIKTNLNLLDSILTKKEKDELSSKLLPLTTKMLLITQQYATNDFEIERNKE